MGTGDLGWQSPFGRYTQAPDYSGLHVAFDSGGNKTDYDILYLILQIN
jgi:hypothetical protein